ncbi:TolC family protein [Tepidanaerobacter sp. EBM-38]|uniref:TolC family protein n=1 Tax=Tepidanaerobacter sp. EBM-38 TaxID=1918496 RepID=UPI000AAA2C2C|nr:TolC family protein [Tepidanaerobacter sp. EBM-38]
MPKAWLSKSVILLLILILITSSFAFAQENNESEDGILKLSLEDAVKIAEENNQQVKLSKLGLEKAELAREQYRYQDKKTGKLEDEIKKAIEQWNQLPEEKQKELEEEGLKPVNPGISSSFEYTYAMDLLEKQTEVGVKLSEVGIDVTVKGINFGIEAAYYGVLLAEENTAIAQAAVSRYQDMLQIAKAKFKAGAITKNEVLDAQVQLSKAEADLLKAESEEEKAYMNLKKLIGLPLDRAIELTDSFKDKPDDFDKTLDELLEAAEKNRIDIMSAEGAFEIAELDFKLSSKAYPSNTFIYKEKEYAMEEAHLKLQDTKSAAEAQIRAIWLDFENAKVNIPVLDKALEMAEESLRLAKLSYEAGLIRSVDVAVAEEGLKQVQVQRLGAIYNYNLARLKLENATYFSVSGNLTF